MSTWKKLKLWLGVTEGYKADAVDRDKDGIVQEGTASERPVKAAPKHKAPAKKKAVAKKTSTAKKTK